MDGDALKLLAPLGVGGILAGIIFGIYRKDAQQWQEAWKGQSQMLLQVVKENTAVLSSLSELIRRVADERERRER